MEQKLTDLIKLLIGHDPIFGLTIEIPQGLYYYSQMQENGNEDVLEGKQISIEFVGHDMRDTRYLTITIKESAIINTPFIFAEKRLEIELDYQIARQIVLSLIGNSESYSVNLITK